MRTPLDKDKYKIAHAAAWDEANRQMIREGRTAWNRKDFNLACKTLKKLMQAGVDHD